MSLVRVIFPYEASDPHQLSLKEGDMITVVQRNPGGWWVGRTAEGEIGIFPSSYTTEVRERAQFNVPKEMKTGQLGGGGVSPRSGGMAGTDRQNSSGGGKKTLKRVSTSNSTSNQSMGASSTANREMAELLGLGTDEYEPSGAFSSQQAMRPDLQRIKNVRREHRQLQGDMRKLQTHQKKLEQQQQLRDQQDEQVDKKVDKLTCEVTQRHQRVTRMEKTLDILRAMMEGSPAEDFVHIPGSETWLVGEDTRPLSAEFLAPGAGGGTAAALPPPPVRPGNGNAGGKLPPKVVQQIVEEVVEEVVEEYVDVPTVAAVDSTPFSPDSCKDEIALKLIKKFKKRLGSAEEQREEYAKQERKLRKKLVKHENAMQEAEARLETLATSGGGGAEAPVFDESLNPQFAELREAIKAQAAKKAKYEKDSVSDEMQADQEQFRGALKKLQKRFARGTTSVEELKPRVEQERLDVQNAQNAIQNGVSMLQQAEVAKKSAEAALQEAIGEEVKALAEVKEQQRYLDAKVEREHVRVAEFKQTLENLKAAAAAAAQAGD